MRPLSVWSHDQESARIGKLRHMFLLLGLVAWLSFLVSLIPVFFAAVASAFSLAVPADAGLLFGLIFASVMLLSLAVSFVTGLLAAILAVVWITSTKERTLARAAMIPLVLFPAILAVLVTSLFGVLDPELLLLW